MTMLFIDINPADGLVLWSSGCMINLLAVVVCLAIIVRSEFADIVVKIAWVAIILLIPIIGPLAYLVWRSKNQTDKSLPTASK